MGYFTYIVRGLYMFILICILFIALCISFIYLLNRILANEKDLEMLFDYYENSFKQIDNNIHNRKRGI